MARRHATVATLPWHTRSPTTLTWPARCRASSPRSSNEPRPRPHVRRAGPAGARAGRGRHGGAAAGPPAGARKPAAPGGPRPPCGRPRRPPAGGGAHVGQWAPARPARPLGPMGIALASAIEDARVEQLLCRDFPGVRRWFVDALAPPPDASDLSFVAFIARMDRLLMLPAWQDDNHWVNKARRLFDATVARAGLEDYAAFRAIASILANDLGQMRVRLDPQHCAVPAPWRDDNSYLWDFGAAQTPPDDTIALQASGAWPPPPAEATGDGSGPPPPGGAHPQLGRPPNPARQRQQERLRPGWCTVIEKMPAWQGLSSMREQGAANDERLTPPALPRARHLERTRRLRRQWEGDDVDLNAAIEALVDRRLRLRPDPRLFMRSGKVLRATSMLVLLDLSESVNHPGPGQTCSLLDIEKQAALLLAASNARNSADRLAIHGFSSNTRNEVYYYRLLEFGKPLQANERAMIGALRGRYSTRIGAAPCQRAPAHGAGRAARAIAGDRRRAFRHRRARPAVPDRRRPHGRGRSTRRRRAHRLHRGGQRGRCLHARLVCQGNGGV